MTAETPAPDTELDAKSKAIIEALQQDGRRSYAEIGRDIGMSEAAVRQRVSKLTAAGVMQIVAVTSPLQLGFHRQAMIGVKVSGDITETARSSASCRRSTTPSSPLGSTTSSSKSSALMTMNC